MYTTAQSIISYGIAVWGGTCVIHFSNLEVTIRTLITIILKKPMSYPKISLFKDFNVLHLKAIYYKNVILNMFKVDVRPFIQQHEYNTRLKIKVI